MYRRGSSMGLGECEKLLYGTGKEDTDSPPLHLPPRARPSTLPVGPDEMATLLNAAVSATTSTFPCPTCGQELSRRGDLKRHIAQLHPTGNEQCVEASALEVAQHSS